MYIDSHGLLQKRKIYFCEGKNKEKKSQWQKINCDNKIGKIGKEKYINLIKIKWKEINEFWYKKQINHWEKIWSQ